jgi:dihydropteroate synthase
MRPPFTWNLGSRRLELGPRTLVMGVVNVTPDSFSDGGLYFEPGAAVEHAVKLLDDGADILDIGGESTRPGAHAGDQPAVTAEEELRRVLPVIGGIKRERPDAIISVDTYKADVVRQVIQWGAEIVNDISGLSWDPDMAATVAELRCGVVLMHTRGRPREWRTLPPLDDPAGTVKGELGEIAARALTADIAGDRIVLDPGFGFGKNFEQNHPLLARFAEFHELGFPLLAGVSRKSFIRKLEARPATLADSQQRLFGSVAAAVICVLRGAHIVRVHDVAETLQAVAVADAAMKGQSVGD